MPVARQPKPLPWRETVVANIARFDLTPREVDIVWCLFAGLSGPEIATALEVRWQTVRNNITALNRKLGTTDQLQIALVLLGILEPRYGAQRREPRTRARPT